MRSKPRKSLRKIKRSRIYGDAGDNFPRYPSDEPFQASDRKWAAEICDSEKENELLSDKYIRVLRDAFVSMDMAQNILVMRTVSGMAMAVAAALDAIHFGEVVGCIAGDDTIMIAVRSVEDTRILMGKIRELMKQ